MDDVAEHDDFPGLIITLQFLESRERVGGWRNGHQLSGEAMRPRIAEVQVSDGEDAFVWKPRGAAAIEDEIVVELEPGVPHEFTGACSILLHQRWNNRSVVSRGSSTSNASLILVTNKANDSGGTRSTCRMRMGFCAARSINAMAPSMSMYVWTASR